MRPLLLASWCLAALAIAGCGSRPQADPALERAQAQPVTKAFIERHSAEITPDTSGFSGAFSNRAVFIAHLPAAQPQRPNVYRTMPAEDALLIRANAGHLDTGFWPNLAYDDAQAERIGTGGWFVIHAGHGGKGSWHIYDIERIAEP